MSGGIRRGRPWSRYVCSELRPLPQDDRQPGWLQARHRARRAPSLSVDRANVRTKPGRFRRRRAGHPMDDYSLLGAHVRTDYGYCCPGALRVGISWEAVEPRQKMGPTKAAPTNPSMTRKGINQNQIPPYPFCNRSPPNTPNTKNPTTNSTHDIRPLSAVSGCPLPRSSRGYFLIHRTPEAAPTNHPNATNSQPSRIM